MSRDELINLVTAIMDADGTEAEIERKINQLKKNIVDLNVTNYIFHDDLTAE